MRRLVAPGLFGSFLVAAVFAIVLACSNTVAAEGVMSKYESQYYTIHTDLDIWKVREANVRMTAMFDEYRSRTKGFSRQIRSRLPFYMFGNPADYYAAGGMPGSAGVFMGKRMMVLASERSRNVMWRVVQHEAWHQFVYYVISQNMPIWVNEGMAEYFGHGIWTGDNLVTGVIPPERLKRVKKMISEKKTLHIMHMMLMSHADWNAALAKRNYDQAWSMVHFLAHADNGKYQKPFSAFIRDISAGRKWTESFVARFGGGVSGFERRYAQWWLALPDDPTRDRYVTATVQTLTSYLARAHNMKQKFADVKAFFEIAGTGKLKCQHPQQWLPPELLKKALADANKIKPSEWSLVAGRGRNSGPRLVLKTPDGTVYTGLFVLRAKDTPKVTVNVKHPGKSGR